MLRAAEIGISIQDLDYLSVGMVLDMFTERIKDIDGDSGGTREATQEDFDNF